jgi:hypothetical protein
MDWYSNKNKPYLLYAHKKYACEGNLGFEKKHEKESALQQPCSSGYCTFSIINANLHIKILFH